MKNTYIFFKQKSLTEKTINSWEIEKKTLPSCFQKKTTNKQTNKIEKNNKQHTTLKQKKQTNKQASKQNKIKQKTPLCTLAEKLNREKQ